MSKACKGICFLPQQETPLRVESFLLSAKAISPKNEMSIGRVVAFKFHIPAF
jgi:hypothetical protein